MLNVLNLEFGYNKNNTNKEKTIYNKGKIIRPLSSNEKFKNEKIKEEKELKKLKRPIESARLKIIRKNYLDENEEEKFYIGEILKSSFEENELEDTFEINADPRINKLNYLKKIGKIIGLKEPKLKPYLPPNSIYESKKKNDKSKDYIKRDLQRTIKMYKENIRIENKIIDMIHKSKFINDDDDDITFKNKKYENVEKEIQILKDFKKKLKKEREKKKENNKDNKFQFIEEEIKGDNVEFNKNENLNNNINEDDFEEKIKVKIKKRKKNKNEKEENKKIKKNKKEEDKEKILEKKEKEKLSLPKVPKSEIYKKITKMNQDKKYKEALKDIKKDNENCEKIKEKILDFNEQLKKNTINENKPKQILTKKQEVIINEKAQKIIDNIKENINPDNFNIENLSPEEQKLIKGRERYKPKKKKYEKDIEKIKENFNDYIYLKSVNSINELIESQNNMENTFKKIHKIGREYKKVNENLNNKIIFTNAYLNNMKEGTKINLEKVSLRKNTSFNTKEDIYDYMYFGKYEKNNNNNSLNESDNTEETNYYHPFLIYD